MVDVSIRFSPLVGFVLSACNEIDIRFVLFEFFVVLLWETMTFYWIIWAPHGDNFSYVNQISLANQSYKIFHLCFVFINSFKIKTWIAKTLRFKLWKHVKVCLKYFSFMKFSSEKSSSFIKKHLVHRKRILICQVATFTYFQKPLNRDKINF